MAKIQKYFYSLFVQLKTLKSAFGINWTLVIGLHLISLFPIFWSNLEIPVTVKCQARGAESLWQMVFDFTSRLTRHVKARYHFGLLWQKCSRKLIVNNSVVKFVTLQFFYGPSFSLDLIREYGKLKISFFCITYKSMSLRNNKED